jgi:hypothetical protein
MHRTCTFYAVLFPDQMGPLLLYCCMNGGGEGGGGGGRTDNHWCQAETLTVGTGLSLIYSSEYVSTNIHIYLLLLSVLSICHILYLNIYSVMQTVLNNLQMTKLSRCHMIWLLPHPLSTHLSR